MYKRGDLHIHSTFSDGSFTPKELVKKAKSKGLDIIAITDHNSMNGVHEAIEEGNKIGIKVIPGVELSARFDLVRVHILGYFPYEPSDQKLFKALKLIKCHNIKLLNKLMKETFNLSYRREHICVEKAIDILRYFGAVVILAHPVMLPRDKFNDVVSIGFDGIEAKYCKNTKADTDFFINYAKCHNMIYTAGSDFHTEAELYRAHGNLGEIYLNEKEIKIFLDYLKQICS